MRDWRSARSDEFFVLGSRDETAGCQLCVSRVAADGSLTLRLRLPDSLAEEQGKYLVIPGVRFKYGHEQVLAALESNAEYAGLPAKTRGEGGPGHQPGPSGQLPLQAGRQGLAGVREHAVDGRASGNRPKEWRHRRGPERRPPGGIGDRR